MINVKKKQKVFYFFVSYCLFDNEHLDCYDFNIDIWKGFYTFSCQVHTTSYKSDII